MGDFQAISHCIPETVKDWAKVAIDHYSPLEIHITFN